MKRILTENRPILKKTTDAICHVINRYAKVNNKHMIYHDKNKEVT